MRSLLPARRLVLGLAVVIATVAGVHTHQAAPRTMHVEGHVVHALTGEPLRGVVVLANVIQGATSIAPAAAFLTAADGRFVFRDLPAGSVGLIALKAGFLNGEIKPFTLPTGRRSDVRVPLVPAGSISGRLLDQVGEPVANASLKAIALANVPVGEPSNLLRGVTGLTDDTGRFTIGSLEAGLYLLLVDGVSGSKPRTYNPVFFPASLTADTATTIEITAGADHVVADMVVTVQPGSAASAPMMMMKPPPVPSPAANSSVSGLVRDSFGRGLSHAAIVMEPLGRNGPPRTILSDESGRFELDAVPAGRFQISASRDGYSIARATALTAPPPVEVDVAPGQRHSGVVLTLAKASVLGGTVLDQFGDPIAGVVSLRLAKTPLIPRHAALANARGEFRIANIVPGEYVLLVDPNSYGRDVRISDGNARGEFRSADSAGEYRLFIDPNPPGRDLRISDSPDHERTVAMLPTYYPGVLDASMATPITISPGTDVTGIDLVIRPEPVTTIDVAIDAGGREIQRLNIARTSLDQPAAPTARGITLPDGRRGFVAATRAGRYLIVASAMESSEAAGRPTLWGSAEVTSDGVTPSSISITLEPSARVSGTLIFDGQAGPPVEEAAMVVMALPVDAGAVRDVSSTSRLGKVESRRASFTIDNVRPGRYLFLLTAFGNPQLRTTWVIKSIVINGRDAIDRPTDLGAGTELTDVVITLSDQISQVSGSVAVDRTAHPAVTVFAFPADPQQWIRGSIRLNYSTVGADGRYSLRGLPAGDYRLAAYDPTEAPGLDDLPLLLKKLLPGSVAVTVRLGETRTQDLAVK